VAAREKKKKDCEPSFDGKKKERKKSLSQVVRKKKKRESEYVYLCRFQTRQEKKKKRSLVLLEVGLEQEKEKGKGRAHVLFQHAFAQGKGGGGKARRFFGFSARGLARKKPIEVARGTSSKKKRGEKRGGDGRRRKDPQRREVEPIKSAKKRREKGGQRIFHVCSDGREGEKRGKEGRIQAGLRLSVKSAKGKKGGNVSYIFFEKGWRKEGGGGERIQRGRGGDAVFFLSDLGKRGGRDSGVIRRELAPSFAGRKGGRRELSSIYFPCVRGGWKGSDSHACPPSREGRKRAVLS